MTVTSDLSFDPKLLEWRGTTDFGGCVEESAEQFAIAYHVLAFIFRPDDGDWLQAFACFARRGAAKADELYQLLMKAI